MIQTEFLFTLVLDLGGMVSMGATPLGERRMAAIGGGTLVGPALRGEVVGGSDCQLVRQDGVLEIDAAYAIRMEGGAIVRVINQGYRHGPDEVLAALARGEQVDPASYFYRSVMRFETGAPELAWLNKTIAVARAERKASCVEFSAWKLL